MNDIVQHQQEESNFQVPSVQTSTSALVLDMKAMESMQKMADIMASGKATIPKHLVGSVGDCMAIVMQAIQWKMNPYAVAQKTHFVNGQIGYEGQLINSAIITSGILEGRPEYEWYGPWERVIGKFDIRKGDKGEYRVPGWSLKDEEGIGIILRATIKGEAIPRELNLLLAQARTRNSPLWADDPRQQLAYLAVKRWARLYAPDVILGVYSPDELDESPRMKDINDPLPKNAKPEDYAKRKRKAAPTGPSQELLDEANAAADKGVQAFRAYWSTLPLDQRDLLRGDPITQLQKRAIDADKNRVIDMPAKQAEAPKTANPPPVDDDFVKQMDAASGYTGDEYVPE